MRNKIAVGIISAILLVVVVAFSGCIEEETPISTPTQMPTSTPMYIPTPGQETTSPIVSKVTDGDTVELQSGERVRLLGINTPEKGQPYHEEATNRLKELIEGKTVTLEKDVGDKDQYGRLLRYVFLSDENINIKLVKEGYANVYIISPNTKYKNYFIQAETEAKNLKIGVWKPPSAGQDVCDDKCINVSYFHWDANGNDCENLNDEYVTFKNTCDFSCDVGGWTVKDESSREPYTFPSFTLGSGATVTLYTGFGTDSSTELYWGSIGRSCNAIWNNNGDTLYLRNSDGYLVLDHSY